MGRKEEVVDTHRKGASGIGEARTASCLPVSRGEAISKALIGVGNGCFVEVTADYTVMAGIMIYEGTNAIGLRPTVGGGFAQLAQQGVRAAFYGLAVRLYDGVGVLVFLLRTQLVAFQMIVDEEQAVAAAVYPAGQAVVVSGGVVDVYGVA